MNGSDTGKITPASVSFAGMASRSLEMSLKGYTTITAAVSDADLKSGGKEFKFEREAGPVRLTISGPFGFEVYQGSKLLDASATHHEVTAQPGAGAVTVRNSDILLSSTIGVDYQHGSMDVSLPATGTLAVFSSNETCKVTVDGQDVGFPPIPAKKIASGSHSVMLKCPDGKDETRRVTVSPGEKALVAFSGSGG
jgi:hypothetical protein